MTTLVPPARPNAPRWLALIPIVILAVPIVISLMPTGMLVSISLGLTVLTYLFTMTTVPIESATLKLFTGIERFEIMAIPSSFWLPKTLGMM